MLAEQLHEAASDGPPKQYARDRRVSHDWPYMSNRAKALLRSGDLPPELWRALLHHYGLGDEGQAVGPTPLPARHIRQVAKLRDKWPYFFKPPAGKVYRGTGWHRRAVEKLVGPIKRPPRFDRFKPKMKSVRVNVTVPLRWNRSWTTDLGVAHGWTSQADDRIPIVLHADSSSDFVFNPAGMKDLLGLQSRAGELEVVPTKNVAVKLIELEGWVQA